MLPAIERLLLVLGLAATFGFLGFRFGRQHRGAPSGRPDPGAPLGALGLLVVIFQYADPRANLDRHVPLPGGLLRDVLYAPGALLVGVAFARARGTSRGRVLAALLAALYAFFATSEAIYVVANAPSNLAAKTEVRDGVVVLQHNETNCVPASGTTLLRLWGLPGEEGAFAVACGTCWYGTPSHRLGAALRGAGLDSLRVKTTWDELAAIGRPCILEVKLFTTTPHAVVLLGIRGRTIVVGDPIVGRQEMERRVFEAWKPWAGEAELVGKDFVHDLGKGDRSPRVRMARSALAVPGDETVDDALLVKVLAFQKERGLPATGRLDARTILALDPEGPRLEK